MEFVIIVLVIGLIITVAIFGARAARKRREELAALAARLGLGYRADEDRSLTDQFEFLDALLDLEKIPNSNIFVFLLSSSLDPGDTAKARLYPLAGYLQKPLNEEKIRQIIQVVELAS